MATTTAFIPIDRRHVLIHGNQLPDRTEGSALVADISGFTSLTGALASEFGRKRGAETVLQFINPIYDALIAELHRYGGSVISFAGDAITCWFDGDRAATAQRATACGFAMQTAMRQFETITTPKGTTVALAIKVAIASGAARRFVVGDPSLQRIDVLAGETLIRMAEAEHHAERGEIVLSAEVATLLGDSLTMREWRDQFAVAENLTLDVATQPWAAMRDDQLSAEIVRPWVIPAIYDRLTVGGAFLGELRPATALFLRFTGIDYDGDDASGAKLDTFVRWVQAILAQYNGTLIQLTVGDKGSFLYAAFGAPNTYGNDTALALAAALDCRRAPSQHTFIDTVQLGLSRGQMWSGACGSTTRHTFGVMGAEVNMSARLMARAEAGQILVNERLIADGDDYLFDTLAPIKVKGRDTLLPIAALRSRRGQVAHSTKGATQLVGHEEARTEILARLSQVSAGAGQLIQIVAAAGLGKSRLAAAVAQQSADSGWTVVTALCQTISRTTLYYPWQQLLRTLFDLPVEPLPNEPQKDWVERQAAVLWDTIATRNAAWMLRLPLLGELFGLPIPDNTTTAAFNPQLRQASLFALVAEIIQQTAADNPLLLLIDDVDRADEASLQLIEAVVAATQTDRVAVVVSYRQSATVFSADLESKESDRRIILTPHSRNEVATMITNQLGARASELLVDLVYAQAHGNPHFTHELLGALRDDQLIDLSDSAWDVAAPVIAALDGGGLLAKRTTPPRLTTDADLRTVALGIPDSVQNVVLTRFDRLPEQQKLALKVASVLGRIFQLDHLVDIYPIETDLSAVEIQMAAVESADFVATRSLLLRLFRHATTYDVIYETLLFAQRRELHRSVVSMYESIAAEASLDELDNESLLAPHYAVLTHHARAAEDSERECAYARLAGFYAAATYANSQAAAYLSRALELTPHDDTAAQFELRLAREAVYDWQAQRELQSADLDVLQQLAEQSANSQQQATVALRQSNYNRWIGDYDAAIAAAQRGQAFAAGLSGDIEVRANFVIGRLLRIQRNYDAARQQLEQTLAEAEAADNQRVTADSLYDLASVQFYLGNHSEALQRYQAAQTHYQQLDARKDQAGTLAMQALILDNMGRYLESRALLQQALEICQNIGYRVGESNVLGNMGVNFEFVGQYDEALQIQQQALAVSQALRDIEGESFALSNLCLLYGFMGELDSAESTAHAALERHRQLDDRRSEAFTLNYLGQALLNGDQVAEARAAFDLAYNIRRELGEEHLLIDTAAGLATTAYRQQQPEIALAHVNTMLSWITTNGTDAIEYPFHVYWVSVEILQAVGDPRAGDVLTEAHTALIAKADAIQDVELRESYLTKIDAHRRIVEAYRS